MIIQCPACGARAKLPDSKEGAKVRCGECSRIYVAGMGRGSGRTSSSSSNQGLWIGLAVAGLAAIVVLFVVNSSGKDPGTQAQTTVVADEAPEPQEPSADSWGYDGDAAKAARELHRLARSRNGEGLRTRLHAPAIFAWKQAVEAEAEARAAAETQGLDKDATEAAVQAALEALPDEAARMEAYDVLPLAEKPARIESYVDDLIDGEGKALVADWEPYEGEMVDLQDATDSRGAIATVRLRVRPVDGESFENRTVEWELHRRGSRWMAARWERYLTDAERDEILRNKLRRGSAKGYERKELSDGSVVLEREPEPLPHLTDTPADVRATIDQGIATMLNLELTREANRARDEVVALGRPAIPPLLTKLYEIPLDTEEQSIQVNIVVVALRDITGQYFGYEPLELVGSGVGTTRERRESSIKQWFAWWYRNESKFTEKVLEDALEGELTEDEKAYLERIK